MARVHGEKVGRKLRFLEAVLQDVRMGQRDFAPWAQRTLHADGRGARGCGVELQRQRLARRRRNRAGFGCCGDWRQPRSPLLFIEALRLCDFGVWRFHSEQKRVDRVEIPERLRILQSER